MVSHRTGALYFNDNLKVLWLFINISLFNVTVVKYTVCLSSTYTYIVVSHTVVHGCIVQLSVNKLSYQLHCVPV